MKSRLTACILIALTSLCSGVVGKDKKPGGSNGGSSPVAVQSCYYLVTSGLNPDSLDDACYVDESLTGGDPGLSVAVDSGAYQMVTNPDRVTFGGDCCYYERYFNLDVALPEGCTSEFAGDGPVRLFLNVDLNAGSAFGQVWGLVPADNGGWDTQGVILDLSWDAVDVTSQGPDEWEISTGVPTNTIPDGYATAMATIKAPATRGNKKVTCGTVSIPFHFSTSVPQ
jgi:hypothetical protein